MSEFSAHVQEILGRIRDVTESPEYLERQTGLIRETVEEERLRLERERNARRLTVGIPVTAWADIDDPKPTDALTAAREFAASPPGCVFLVLSGKAGVGKTRAACWLLDTVTAEPVGTGPVPRYRTGQYVLAHELVMAGTFGEGASIWRDLDAADVIAIDEVGGEYRNASFEATLYTLLNKRHANGQKTVLCTNLDARTFADRYCPTPTDPLRDRLKTGGRWVNLSGASLRPHWQDAAEDRES
jgi:DNA replication protein DnaC